MTVRRNRWRSACPIGTVDSWSTGAAVEGSAVAVDFIFPGAAIRAAPDAARAPRPPCPAGRFRCRTSATARTTGSPAGIRTPRSPRPSPPTTPRSARSRDRRNPHRRDSRRRRRSSAGPSTGPTAVDTPPMSPRSQLATSGSSPIAACSAACSDPGIRSGFDTVVLQRFRVIVHITALVSRVRVGMSSSTKSITSPVQLAAQIADHRVAHRHRNQAEGDRPERRAARPVRSRRCR